MYDLNGQVALVTGAGGERGIGYAVAARLAEEGADVVVSDLTANARGDWGGLPAVVANIEKMGRQAMSVETDVTDSDQVANLVQQALDRLGPFSEARRAALAVMATARRIPFGTSPKAWRKASAASRSSPYRRFA